MRDLSQGARVMFLTSWIPGCENGMFGFVVVVGDKLGCEVRVGCGICSGGSVVEPF